MARRSGLGKGLSALIPSEATGESDSLLRVVPISHIRPNAFQPRSHFDEESMAVAGGLHPRGRAAPAGPGAGARGRSGELRADRGGAALAGGPAGRPPDDPRPGPGGRRRGQPGAGAGREPPPGRPQRPRGGGRLPAAHRRVRSDPRAGGDPHGQGPGDDHQHPAAAAAAGGGPACPGRADDLGRPRPGPARHARPGAPGEAGRADRRARG